MKSVAHLFAGAIEAEIAPRQPCQVRVNPVGKDSLIGRAELARSGEHATAVNPYRKTKGVAILQANGLTGKLGSAIQRNRRSGGEAGIDAFFGDARRESRSGVQSIGAGGALQRERAQSRDRIDSTAAEQNQAGAVAFGI